MINLSQDIIILAVRNHSDIGLAARKAHQLAKEIGFPDVAQEEIKITVTELASNLIVHKAVEGTIFLYPIHRCDDSGIAVVASDQGPGMASISSAMSDHSSTAGSMGCGLGAVKRLMDEFDIVSTPVEGSQHRADYASYKGGTLVVGRKWCNGHLNKSEKKNTFQWGAISRPLPGYEENGDAFYITETNTDIFAVVIDALGHGPEAEEAAEAALSCLKANAAMSFDYLFPHLHEMLRTTRGVALTAVSLDKISRTFTHAAVGNVESRLFPNQTNSPLTRAGVLGHGQLPPLRIHTYPWPDNGTLIIHSDGISGRWGHLPETDTFKHHPLLVSHLLLNNYERPRDDASVLVISEVNNYG